MTLTLDELKELIKGSEFTLSEATKEKPVGIYVNGVCYEVKQENAVKDMGNQQERFNTGLEDYEGNRIFNGDTIGWQEEDGEHEGFVFMYKGMILVSDKANNETYNLYDLAEESYLVK